MSLHTDCLSCAFSQDTDRRTPLIVACENNHTGIVRLLVAAGAACDFACTKGIGERRTPLSICANCGYADIAVILCNAGATVGALDGNGRTYLTIAATRGWQKVVVVLLEAGADVNATEQGGDGATALIAAVGCCRHRDSKRYMSVREREGGGVNVHKRDIYI